MCYNHLNIIQVRFESDFSRYWTRFLRLSFDNQTHTFEILRPIFYPLCQIVDIFALCFKWTFFFQAKLSFWNERIHLSYLWFQRKIIQIYSFLKILSHKKIDLFSGDKVGLNHVTTACCKNSLYFWQVGCLYDLFTWTRNKFDSFRVNFTTWKFIVY